MSAVTVFFAPDQLKRLADAAALVTKTSRRKVTVEDLIVAGAMAGLDHSSSSLRDAVGGIVNDIKPYARDRLAYADPEAGAHDALQSDLRN